MDATPVTPADPEARQRERHRRLFDWEATRRWLVRTRRRDPRGRLSDHGPLFVELLKRPAGGGKTEWAIRWMDYRLPGETVRLARVSASDALFLLPPEQHGFEDGETWYFDPPCAPGSEPATNESADLLFGATICGRAATMAQSEVKRGD